jgi:FlaA1/EpsC-like NDP-sugar epimerase
MPSRCFPLGGGGVPETGLEISGLEKGAEAIPRDLESPQARSGWLRVARAASRIGTDIPMAVIDCFVVVVAYTALLLLRFELDVPAPYWRRFGLFLAIAIVVHLAMNRLWGAYGQMWRHASVREARALLLAGASSAILLLGTFAWQEDRVPLTVVVVGPVVATLFMGAARFQYRLFAFRRSASRPPGLHVAVVGAGAAGAAVVREMQTNERIGMTPVVLVDDDPRIRGRSLQGVPVAGAIDDLGRIISDYDVHQVLVAMEEPRPEVAERVADAAGSTGVPVKVLPDIADMLHGRVSVREARDLAIDDLLGRQQAEVDLEGARALFGGQRVLVTGGGGSIGNEIASQIARLEPSALVLLDHDETHLHDATQRLPPFVEQVLADVCDQTAIDGVFGHARPDVVFHAAAHKHVPILERHACAALATNVFGTVNVIEAAVRAGTERLVLVSTDKAATPASVMGASKWMAEQAVLARSPSDGRYCSVRFGNVLGSRGSVIPTFQGQIDAGGPVTVTDARMTRFFMSTREAVSLVVQAAAICENHEVFMLEMGEPVNVLDLARRMIELNGYDVGRDISIEITGPRPGEQLSELVHGQREEILETPWPSILALRPIILETEMFERMLDELRRLVTADDDDGARSALLRAAAISEPTGQSPNGEGNRPGLDRRRARVTR